MKEPLTHHVKYDGRQICVYEWEGEGPTILLAHATGFHGRCWDQVVKHLGNAHVYAVDHLGHGQSDEPAFPIDWRQFGESLATVAEKLDLHDIYAVGHSMGGHSVIIAASQQPQRFKALMLIDPVIFSPSGIPVPWGDLDPADFPVARRQAHFESPEAMMERLRDKAGYKMWDPAVFRDYCVHGLIPTDANYELACKPLTEASIYVSSAHNDIYTAIESTEQPVQIIRVPSPDLQNAQVDFTLSPTYPDLVKHFKNGSDVVWEDSTHFIPMQYPKRTADAILDFVRENA